SPPGSDFVVATSAWSVSLDAYPGWVLDRDHRDDESHAADGRLRRGTGRGLMAINRLWRCRV
ncbi:MAG: hypothetical protein ACR2RL_06520, partial [Gammaproteobacteria bacterium]